MRRPGLAIWAAVTVLLMAGSSLGTWWATQNGVLGGTVVPASMRQNKEFTRFVQVYDSIRRETIWHNTPKQLLAGAINGMVGTLHDQFSDYFSSSQNQSFQALLNPTFVGIGVEVSASAPQLVIEQVFPKSPASRAGLAQGDIITAVNGQLVSRVGTAAAVNMIHGKVGTTVRLAVSIRGKQKIVVLKRAVIDEPTVYSYMMPHQIAYMNIVEFGNNTGAEVVSQFHQLVKDGARGLLLDLRDNPGGEVAQALTAANALVPAGPVVSLHYKNPSQDQTLDSSGPGTKLPIVVLVNGETASAAEILSAAITERQGGTLVGTRTYGKGIVQELIPLANHAALKLTVAKYYTPDGQYIEHKGLTPSVYDPEASNVVPSDIPAEDPQLAKAVTVLLKKMGQ
ncbi:MAG: S41 family peptidase [Firmicutes bacterium]|nr:S41 family peptidase [Bacillota bacterium]